MSVHASFTKFLVMVLHTMRVHVGAHRYFQFWLFDLESVITVCTHIHATHFGDRFALCTYVSVKFLTLFLSPKQPNDFTVWLSIYE